MTPITPAMIRRRPFAAPGHMITDHDEAFIAAHMRATVTQEQRSEPQGQDEEPQPPALPKPQAPGKMTPAEARARGHAAARAKADWRYKRYAARIGDAVLSRSDIALLLNVTPSAAGAITYEMMKRGMLDVAGHHRKARLYRVKK